MRSCTNPTKSKVECDDHHHEHGCEKNVQPQEETEVPIIDALDPRETYEATSSQNIFRGAATPSKSQHHPSVLRAQTFDSAFLSPSHSSTPNRIYSFSPNRSPTFPFRPNTALRSYQITREISASFDEQIHPSINRVILSPSSLDDISIVAESEKQPPSSFPVNPIPISSGNWWLDEIASFYPALTQGRESALKDEYIEHIVSPTDTLQGICLTYKVSAMRLKKENGFTGNSLQMAPKILRIPTNTNYGMNLQRQDKTNDDELPPKNTDSISTSQEVAGIPNNTVRNESILKQFSDDKNHYSKDDMLILQDIMQKLKDEMNHTDDMEPEKKHELEALMRRLESTITQDDLWKASLTDADESTTTDAYYENIRKPLVAAAGGTLVTAGAILVPVPIIPGALVIYAGLSVLASEFEVANQALEKMKDPLRDILAPEGDYDFHREVYDVDDTTVWTDCISTSLYPYLYDNDINDEFKSLIQVSASQSNIDEFNETTRKTKNELKRWARNLLRIESSDGGEDPITDDKLTSEKSMLKRFDSLLSSYGEEVDIKGVVESDSELNDNSDPKEVDITGGIVATNSEL